jgi:hypothetical protein
MQNATLSINPAPVVKTLKISELEYDKYQRPLEMSRVMKIVRGYDSRLMQVIDVSYRNGKYYVYDGQHRAEALEILGEDEIKCQVHFGMTYQDESMKFADLNNPKNKKAASAWDEFKAKIEGEDRTSWDIKTIVEKAGFTLGDGYDMAKNRIIAIKTITNVHKQLGNEGFYRLLRLIKETWHDDQDGVNSRILAGMGMFIKKYNNDFEDRDFVQRLSKIKPYTIVLEGRSMPEYPGYSSSTPYAIAIWRQFNKRNRNPLPYRF